MASVTKPHGDFVNNVDVANASYVDDQFNTLYNLVNGGLDSANAPSLGYAITAISATVALTSSQVGIIECTAGANGITLTLPTAATTGLRFILKKVDSGVGVVTINTTSSQTMDGQLNRTLVNQYAEIHVISNGSNWDVIIENIVDLPTFAMSRQAIINGNFDVWQRGTSFPSDSSGKYIADRWLGLFYGTNTSYSQVSITDLVGTEFGVQIQNTSGVTNYVGSIVQRIESANSALLKGKQLTLSLKVKCSESKTFTIAISSPSAKDNFGTTTQRHSKTDCQTVVGAWTTITFTFTPTDAEFMNGMEIQLGDQDTNQQIAAGGYYIYAQVQLNLGSQMLPFQPRSFAEELVLCQRYYQRGFQFRATGTFYSSTTASMALPCTVPMRIAGTLLKISSSVGIEDIGSASLSSTGSLSNVITAPSGAKFDLAGFTGANTFRLARLYDDSLQLDAEL